MLTGDLEGKTVFVTGGSGGLGKALSLQLAARGAHVTIFGRRSGPLLDAVEEIKSKRLTKSQEVRGVSIDLGDAAKVDETFKSQPRTADMLYCVAGGNHAENGFLLDITASKLESCMNNNYFSAAYAAKSILDIWTSQDVLGSAPGPQPRRRKLIFVNSAAAFVSLPGSIAYSPAKCALRSLSDTLRMEVLRYCCPESEYTVHCAFPADFVSPGFQLEQKTKTPLTKRIQGLDVPLAQLEAKFPSSDEVASGIIKAVDRGDYVICSDSLSASCLFTGMMGPSPKRGWGIFDSVVSVLVNWVVWPFLRRKWEGMTREDGTSHKIVSA